MAPSNSAAFLVGSKDKPLSIRPSKYLPPGPGQLTLRNHALAINPLDWLKQDLPSLVFGWLKYPCVLGTDVAGEVYEVGSNVTRFKPGDRIVGNTVGLLKEVNDNAQGGFQEYVLLREEMTSAIPEWMSFEKACVLPLGLATAACGLFLEDQMALGSPMASNAKATGKTVLIWGASTSVGCCAVQLARAAGYEVIATCSPKNNDMVRSLGAGQIFDYRSPTCIADITVAFKGKTTAGALAIGTGAVDACVDIMGACEGRKFVSAATAGMPDPIPQRFTIPRIIRHFLSWMIHNTARCWWKGVGYKMIFGCPDEKSGLRKVLFEEYLPQALSNGSFVPSPAPEVVGRGLENVQKGMDVQRNGVSAKKIVVTL